MHKLPLTCFLVAAVLYKRKLMKMHSDVACRLFYVRVTNTNVRMYNAFVLSHLTIMVLNLTSICAGICLSGYKYTSAVHKHYLNPIKEESTLIKHNLKDIIKYHDFEEKFKNEEKSA